MYFAKYGPFTLGDIKFDIRIYPLQDYAYCYVCLLSDAELVKKFACMSVYNKFASASWEMGRHNMLDEEFKKDNIAEGLGLPMARVETFPTSKWRDATKHTSLLFKLILRLILDDSQKILAKPNTPEQAVSPPDVEPPIADQIRPNVICFSGLSTALLTEEFADVHFVINGQTFPAHRVVLAARSSVFRSEFLALQNDLSKHDMFVSVQHLDALTFKCLLHFIYTDSLPSDFHEAISSQQRYRSLFIAAHLFKVDGLKIICEEKLTGAVIDGILSALDLMNFHDGGLLKIFQKDAI
ncbi:hypothetical protein LUZ63_000188 [Rhynchospora breviuscula]|uniref:BTB domain-containing protein n=1 Tax=Rhynchospora breviuscula TaxID=2022672 RepID=A0A9Q0HVU3_9POAL|nr:hypothetical protein LUZ63_000188 [Rhynchospora breviuscula]